MKKLILIRRGETDYVLQRKYCGHENISLNAKGIEQAHYLQNRLKKIKVDAVYSSGLKRSFQTAKIVFQDKVIHKKKELREINFGQFSGLSYEENAKLCPDVYKAWLTSPMNAKIPKGESLFDFSKRVEKCFDRIVSLNAKKTVAIISRGGPIRIIFLKILRQGLDKFWDIQQDSAALNIIEFSASGGKNNKARIVKVNDTSYLK